MENKLSIKLELEKTQSHKGTLDKTSFIFSRDLNFGSDS
jgi:hypothetical protein